MIEQRVVELFGKETLVADFRQWHVRDFITGRVNNVDLDFEARMNFHQAGPDMFCLPQSQCAAARANANHATPCISDRTNRIAAVTTATEPRRGSAGGYV